MITTDQFADRFKVKPATIRRGYCLRGHYFGQKPVKLPNGRLLWPDITPHDIAGKKNKPAGGKR